MGETIENVGSNSKIYVSNLGATAPASPGATFFLWLLLTFAAFVVFFVV